MKNPAGSRCKTPAPTGGSSSQPAAALYITVLEDFSYRFRCWNGSFFARASRIFQITVHSKKHKLRDGFDERDIFRFHLGGVLQKKQWCTENKCVSGKGHKTASRGLWRLAIKKIRGFSNAKQAKTAGFFHKTQLARRLVYFATEAFIFCRNFIFVVAAGCCHGICFYENFSI